MVKKVHYCWFGSAQPRAVMENIAKWKILNPDFTFYEWTEQNIDVSKYEFGRRALEQKRWAFLADIIRLQKLYEEGGFHLDADVELIRPLNVLEAEGDNMILGYIYDCAFGTAIIYSPPQHSIIEAILTEYQSIRPDAWPVISSVFTDYFINNLSGFLLNGKRWKHTGYKISLYPKEFFEQPAFVRQRGVAIHHASGSWMPAKHGDAFTTGPADYSHSIKWLKRKLRTFYSLLQSEYRETYFRALWGVSTHKPSHWKEEVTCKF
jgi:mannosyltransferase OCH1-like enzyme